MQDYFHNGSGTWTEHTFSLMKALVQQQSMQFFVKYPMCRKDIGFTGIRVKGAVVGIYPQKAQCQQRCIGMCRTGETSGAEQEGAV